MLEDIEEKILSLFTKDYSSVYSIRQITKLLNINYANAFKRIKSLVKDNVLIENKTGQANSISFNIKDIHAIQLISYVEEMESKKIKNSALPLLIKEAVQVDPFSCIGLFGSRVSGKATKESDWDVFIITDKRRDMEKIMKKFPHIRNIQLQVITSEEFRESLLSIEETIVKHIVKNKQILYNPHPFYNIIYKWEMIKNVPG